MNKDKIKKLLDKTDISIVDEINILEYIDELEQVKEDYIKSLDKLDVLEDTINIVKNIYISMQFSAPENMYVFIEKLGNILRGKDNDNKTT